MELASTFALAHASPMTRTGFTPVHAAGDAELVQQVRDGDEVAFADLYRRYARMVHGLLLARTPLAEVDDLVQDVFLTAWKQLNSLRDPDARAPTRCAHALAPAHARNHVGTDAGLRSLKLIKDSCEFAHEGSMPLPEYVHMHSDMRLSAEDIEALCSWEAH